jgi:hypothetical protein
MNRPLHVCTHGCVISVIREEWPRSWTRDETTDRCPGLLWQQCRHQNGSNVSPYVNLKSLNEYSHHGELRDYPHISSQPVAIHFWYFAIHNPSLQNSFHTPPPFSDVGKLNHTSSPSFQSTWQFHTHFECTCAQKLINLSLLCAEEMCGWSYTLL